MVDRGRGKRVEDFFEPGCAWAVGGVGCVWEGRGGVVKNNPEK